MASITDLITNIRRINIKTDHDVFSSEFLQSLPHKTPFFVFSKKKILNNFAEFNRLFPGSLVQYAMKANSEPELLKLLLHEGCGFEVASVYELNMLKKIHVPAERIVYGSSIKPAAHIKDFFNYGVNRFAVDSMSELEKIAIQAPGSRVYARAIANDSGSTFKFSEKFGTDIHNIVSLLTRAKELGLHPYGISFHVGSQATDPLAWVYAINSLRPIIEELKEKGIILDALNLGGGFPCKYVSSEDIPSLEQISQNTLSEYNKLPYQPRIILEPGRGMVADTGVLVVTVIARVERKSNTWLFLDAGVYNGLFEAMAYQGSTRYPVTSMRPVKDSGESMFALAGPTGDSPDVITREVLLPQDIDVGDKLIIHNVGAYSLTVISEFNGFPRPEVYFY